MSSSVTVINQKSRQLSQLTRTQSTGTLSTDSWDGISAVRRTTPLQVSTKIKLNVLNTLNAAKTTLGSMVSVASRIKDMEDTKLVLAGRMITMINTTGAMDEGLRAQYDALTDAQYRAALDFKTAAGVQTLAQATGNVFSLDSSNNITTASTQLRIDILTANSASVRGELSKAAENANAGDGAKVLAVQQDKPIWLPGAAAGASGTKIDESLNTVSVTSAMVNGILNRQLAAYSGVAALVDSTPAAINNILTIGNAADNAAAATAKAVFAQTVGGEIIAEINKKLGTINMAMSAVDDAIDRYKADVEDGEEIINDQLSVDKVEGKEDMVALQLELLSAMSVLNEALQHQRAMTQQQIQ